MRGRACDATSHDGTTAVHGRDSHCPLALERHAKRQVPQSVSDVALAASRHHASTYVNVRCGARHLQPLGLQRPRQFQQTFPSALWPYAVGDIGLLADGNTARCFDDPVRCWGRQLRKYGRLAKKPLSAGASIRRFRSSRRLLTSLPWRR